MKDKEFIIDGKKYRWDRSHFVAADGTEIGHNACIYCDPSGFFVLCKAIPEPTRLTNDGDRLFYFEGNIYTDPQINEIIIARLNEHGVIVPAFYNFRHDPDIFEAWQLAFPPSPKIGAIFANIMEEMYRRHDEKWGANETRLPIFPLK